MSLQYEVLKRLVKAMNIKKRWTGMSTEELLENRRRENAKNRIPNVKDDDFIISRIEVMGCPVLKLIHKQPADHANLFLIGGGMISAPRPGSIKKALRFAKETGLDLFVPYYPLCTDYPLTRAYEMIHETYRVMLRHYAAERISVLGTSSGGNLALGIVPFINDGHGDTPMPGYIMAISPGTCVDSEAEWQRMLELDKKDVAIPAEYMKTAVEIMRHGDDSVPDYMIWLQRGNFTNCPKVTFIYGSDETLYACAPSFETAMKKYGVDYEMIVGEGMFHCYPVFPICKEAKEGWELMIHKMIERTEQKMKPDYKNWMPKGMVCSAAAGAAGCLGLAAVCGCTGLIKNESCRRVATGGLLLAGACAGGAALWMEGLYRAFSYEGKRQMSRQIIEGIANYVTLPEGGVGLDVGCGSGALTIACAKRNPQARFVGIDRWGAEYASYNKPLCEANAAAEGVENTEFRQGNAVKLPFADECFDAVTSNYVYHNIPSRDRQAILLETLRVLKKGGCFAIHDIMSKAKYGDMEAFADKLRRMGYEKVELIDTTNGKFMSHFEAAWMGLSGSKLLVGRK